MRRRYKPESPSARGARFELIAAAGCMQEGFTVFRNQSPVGKSDLLVQKNNVILRVQVRSTIDQWSEALKGNDVLIVVSVNNLTPRFYTNQPRARWRKLFDAIEVLRKKKRKK